MIDFTLRKFQGLPIERRHKKCAELIRDIYDRLWQQQNYEKELQTYLELTAWMKGPGLDLVTSKTLSDRYHFHRRLTRVQHKEHHLLPHVRLGDKNEAEKPYPIAIYLDRLRSAHNVGSIVRTTEAFSLGTLYFSEDTPSIDHKQVEDAAMGAQKWVSCYQGIPLADLPHPIIILETSDEAVSLYDYIFPETFTLVVGNEEYGCSDEILKMADDLVEIPLRGHKNSLNVANAFAIAASEIARQKRQSLRSLNDRD